MGTILKVNERSNDIIERLVDIWETSVRKTHTFLAESDIVSIKPEVRLGLLAIESLYCYSDDNNKLQGFMGIVGNKVEMLFVDADAIGQGIGKLLLNYAVCHSGVMYVDVNEQNTQGVGFYYHMGFQMIERSELDDQGRAFPILHLKKSDEIR